MKKCKEKTSAKVVAGILCWLLSIVLAIGIILIVLCLRNGIYTLNRSDIIDNKARESMNLAGMDFIFSYARDPDYLEEHMDGGYENICYEIVVDGKKVLSNYSGTAVEPNVYIDASYGIFHREDEGNFRFPGNSYIRVYPKTDMISVLDPATVMRIDLGLQFRYLLIVAVALLLVLSVILYIFLMSSAGHQRGTEGIVLNRFDKIPFDLIILFLLFCLSAFVKAVANLHYLQITGDGGLGLCSAVLVPPFILCSMSFAARIKAGAWWINTLCYRFGRQFRRYSGLFADNLKSQAAKTSLVVKIIVIFILIAVIEFFVLGGYVDGKILLLFCIEKAVILALIILIAIWIQQLQIASEKLSAGDLAYVVDTGKMFGTLKKHGENLNHISNGMTVAIDEKMKSERLKTELITNVSHDIKTPLTSIINYVDLLKNEETDNPKVVEYLEVLSRQSDKLKRLIVDLVDASKFSTGNIEVNTAPCDIGVLSEQIVGEYKDKLTQAKLELIVDRPEESLYIRADGHHLWRVFDNLMNNTIKYAQQNTRVYLHIEKVNASVCITLKNMSGSQLNISPEELMDRFVRGDAARNTEGNGLGLSIAKSLVEAQDGKLNIVIDGDLFKVILEFPAI